MTAAKEEPGLLDEDEVEQFYVDADDTEIDIEMEVSAVYTTHDGNTDRNRGLFGKLVAWNRRRKENKNGESDDEAVVLLNTNETLALLMGNHTDTMNDAFPLTDGTKIASTLSKTLGAAADSLKTSPTLVTAQIPLALVVGAILVRALWYYRQHHRKVTTSNETTTFNGEHQQNNHTGKALSDVKELDPAKMSDRNSNGQHSVVMTASTVSTMDDASSKEVAAQQLEATLQRESSSKQSLLEENQALQKALESHKSTVDKFNEELQARNERLSVFEQEQDTVRRDLSVQIDLLKQELQERQKQEQGNLKSKESLCNDLITKIQALNQDLENHEDLWKGVAQKAQQKEAESAKKVQSLQKTLQDEEQQRVATVAAKDEAVAELNAQMDVLNKQRAEAAAQNAALEKRMGAQAFATTEATLQKRLEDEQKHTTTLSTKLNVFSAELQAREERVSALDAKMKDVERMSVSELKQLQRELQDQVTQREKLQQTAIEMARLLQEKQDQCVRLQTQWESSKAELEALDQRVITLTADLAKREALVKTKLEAVEMQLEEERRHQEQCQKAADATNEELIKKQEEFVQLTTRMDLFIKELQFRDEQVASLEAKLMAKEDLTTSELKELSEQLNAQRERRDSWTKTTEDLQQLLKDKKAQVVGLTTRVDLFERELKNRQEVVAALRANIEEREEEEAIKMEPRRKELRRLQEERDSWREKTEDIARSLEEKTAQTEGLMTRLKLFRAELAQKDARVKALRTTFNDKRQSVHMEMTPMREKLELLREQRDQWAAKTEQIDTTLKEKRAQCVGLSTRVSLFKKELETKEAVTTALARKIGDKEEVGDASIAKLRKQVAASVAGRDEWKESTARLRQGLAEKRNESAGLTAELKGLVSDLQSYQQRRAALENQLKEQRTFSDDRRAALEVKRRGHQEHRDEWKIKVDASSKELTEAEQTIVGLETRNLLFERELHQRRDSVAALEEHHHAIEEKSSAKVTRLREAIAADRVEHEERVETTVMLHKALKDSKRECIGLTTRCKIFTNELEKRELAVTDQEGKIREVAQEAADSLGRLRGALSALENERDEWHGKSVDIDALVVLNQEETIGLGTRLELFMSQIMGHEEMVFRLEQKVRSQRSASPREAATKELEAAKEKRDQWTAKAIDIESNLKQRKSEIVGLKTRQGLFHLEMKRREEQVAILQDKVNKKEQHYKSKIAPMKDAHQRLLQDRDEWALKVAGLEKMLNDKQEQCLPNASKLEKVIDQLTHCQARISNNETLLGDEEAFAMDKLVGLKRKVELERNELSQWEERTNEVKALLNGKRRAAVGLKNRVTVFQNELQAREGVVKAMESQIAENDRRLEEEIEMPINAKIEAEYQRRDSIIETTLVKNQELKGMEDTCSAMEVRLKLFESELRNRTDQASVLQAKLREKDEDYTHQLKVLKADLSLKLSDRDKWRESTMSMEAHWKETEGECVGLATRLQLFTLELQKLNDQVAEHEEKYKAKANDAVEQISPIHFKLQQEQREHESWNQKTTEVNDLLQENRKEIVGLRTRSKLFERELNQKDECVTTLAARLEEGDKDFADRIAPLRREYNSQKEGCNAWEKSTLDVKRLLEKTKVECASIPTRLDLFRREQKTRDDCVADLEATINNKDDLVAVQLGFLLNELQLQQKQRGKWKKVTLEMHRLLKETKEEVASLTQKLNSSQAALTSHHETINNLETALQDGRTKSAQHLTTMKKEVGRQREMRDQLRRSTKDVDRRLEEAKEQCEDVAAKLLSSKTQVQDCTSTIERLQKRVIEKKAEHASQLESVKAQLSIHVVQRAEWRENTNQMKQRLKEKQLLCAGLQTNIDLLKRLQQGLDVRSSLTGCEDNAPVVGLTETSAHLERISDISNSVVKKLPADENFSTRMDTLENELRAQREEEKKLNVSTRQLEKELGEKESQCAVLTGRLETYTSQSSSFDTVDTMLKEKENKQSSLNSRLASLTGELLNL
jgi:chromosome segregation ATPase